MRRCALPIDGFLVALAGAVLLAAAWPAGGVSGGVLRIDRWSQLAVSLVFFLHGAELPLESLARGVRNLRLHLLAQLFTYGVFPLLGALVFLLAAERLTPGLGLGFVLLSAISSTISSSVALTALGRGNVPGALFNATLSGVIGVFLTPLLVSLVAGPRGLSVPLPAAIGTVALRVLLPLALGQLARPRLAGLLKRQRLLVVLVDRGSILLIVYGAFADSIAAGTWERGSAGSLALVVALAACLLATVTAAAVALSRWLGLAHGDEVAAVFCASQKSLANGLPIARVLFGASPLLGQVVLPLIVYHQLQLALGAVLARRYALRSSKVPP